MSYRDTLHYLRNLRSSAAPRKEWVIETRARLEAHMAAHPMVTEVSDVGPRRAAFLSFNMVWRFAAAGLSAIVLAGGGIVLAAQRELPGDNLYPVKLFAEQVQTMVAPSLTDKAKLTLAHASLRIAEAEEVANLPDKGSDLKVALSNYEVKLSTLNTQLLDLQKQGNNSGVKEIATALSSASSEHQDALKRLEVSMSTNDKSKFAVVTDAEKASAASDEAAGKALIQLALGSTGAASNKTNQQDESGRALPASGLNTQSNPSAADQSFGSDTESNVPTQEGGSIEGTPSAGTKAEPSLAKPEAPVARFDSEEQTLKNSQTFAAARDLALAKYNAAAKMLDDFKTAFTKVKNDLDPAAVRDIQARVSAAHDLLGKAKVALTDNVVLTSFERSSGVIIMVIDAQFALKAAPRLGSGQAVSKDSGQVTSDGPTQGSSTGATGDSSAQEQAPSASAPDTSGSSN